MSGMESTIPREGSWCGLLFVENFYSFYTFNFYLESILLEMIFVNQSLKVVWTCLNWDAWPQTPSVAAVCQTSVKHHLHVCSPLIWCRLQSQIRTKHTAQGGALSPSPRHNLCICIRLGNEACKSVMSTAANEAAPGNILHTAHLSCTVLGNTNATIIGWKMPL